MDIILDDEFMTSRYGGFHLFLVKWHGRPDSNILGYKRMIFVIWIFRCWIATFTLTLQSRVLFNQEGMMRHGVGPYLGLDEIGSPSPMMIFIIISCLFNRTFWPKPKSISVRVFCWCL